MNSIKSSLLLLIFLLPIDAKSGIPSENKMTPEQEAQWEQIQKEREEYDKKLWEELKNNPPKPPWIEFPDYDRYSIGWRMGAGEDHIHKLYVYFKNIEPNVYESYKNKYPEPKDWKEWYED